MRGLARSFRCGVPGLGSVGSGEPGAAGGAGAPWAGRAVLCNERRGAGPGRARGLGPLPWGGGPALTCAFSLSFLLVLIPRRLQTWMRKATAPAWRYRALCSGRRPCVRPRERPQAAEPRWVPLGRRLWRRWLFLERACPDKSFILPEISS